MRSKFQAFDSETISRSQIKNAPYNPRIMNKETKKRLKEAIRKHGLVSALTWNKRTGNLVGGHQRLEQLDALEGNKDYELTVNVVDVPEREEVELNVQLNNPSLQGSWDLDKLSNVACEYSLSADDMGFSQTDAEFLFDGDDRFTELFNTEESENVKRSLKDIKNARTQMNDSLKEKGRIDFFSVIVFASPEERELFYRSINVPISEQYITPEQVKRLKED